MKISRRNFLWVSGAAITASLAAKLGCAPKEPVVDPGGEEPIGAEPEELRVQYASTVTQFAHFAV
jgi:hypothetical protein